MTKTQRKKVQRKRKTVKKYGGTLTEQDKKDFAISRLKREIRKTSKNFPVKGKSYLPEHLISQRRRINEIQNKIDKLQ